MRIEMGLLQLETSGRPDGERPEGASTYFDYLRGKTKEKGANYTFSLEECAEAGSRVRAVLPSTDLLARDARVSKGRPRRGPYSGTDGPLP